MEPPRGLGHPVSTAPDRSSIPSVSAAPSIKPIARKKANRLFPVREGRPAKGSECTEGESLRRKVWLQVVLGELLAGQHLALGVDEQADGHQDEHANQSHGEHGAVSAGVLGDEGPDVGAARTAEAQGHADVRPDHREGGARSEDGADGHGHDHQHGGDEHAHQDAADGQQDGAGELPHEEQAQDAAGAQHDDGGLQVDVAEQAQAQLADGVAGAVEGGQLGAGDEGAHDHAGHHVCLRVVPHHVAGEEGVDVADGVDQEAEQDGQPEDVGPAGNVRTDAGDDRIFLVGVLLCRGLGLGGAVGQHALVLGAVAHQEHDAQDHDDQGHEAEGHVAGAPTGGLDDGLADGNEQHAAEAGECGADADHQASAGAEPAVHDRGDADAQHDGIGDAGDGAADVQHPQLGGHAEQDEDQGLNRGRSQDHVLAVALGQPHAGNRRGDDARDVVQCAPHGDLRHRHAEVLRHDRVVDAGAAVQDCGGNAADQDADDDDGQIMHEAFFHQLRSTLVLSN